MFSTDGNRIRASQGHSVTDVALVYAECDPPAVLYHGTVGRTLDAIFRDGLLKMSRHYVHLSGDVETATAVAARRGKPVVLSVDAAGMRNEGHMFWRSENGVWLVDQVPPAFLQIVS